MTELFSAVTPLAWILLAAALLAAVGDWTLAAKPVTTLRRMTKGAVPALIVLALAVQATSHGKPSWPAVVAVGALVLCLLGDLFLLEDSRFVAGAIAFGVAHALFGFSLLWDSQLEGADPVPGLIVTGTMALLSLPFAVRIVAAAGRQGQGAVAAVYLLAIVGMALCAGVDAMAPGGWFAVAGAGFFMLSDSILSWRRFVKGTDNDSALVMITYHLALFGLGTWALVS